MKTIASTELKAESLAMLEGAGPDGLVITIDGKPVARLLPIEPPRRGNMAKYIGVLKGQVNIKGDIISSISSGPWNDADS